MKFKTTLRLVTKTATFIDVPPEVVAALGKGKRPPVKATINRYTYRTTVSVMGGMFIIPASAEVRKGSGIAAGDEITVDLSLDTEPRVVDVPADLAKALAKSARAKAAYEKLSYTNQKEIVVSLESAKTEETRARRLAKAMERLNA